MTAYVTIPVASRHNVERVPNTALRYHPAMQAEELRRLYGHAGINPRTIEAPDLTPLGDTMMSVAAGGTNPSTHPKRAAPPLEGIRSSGSARLVAGSSPSNWPWASPTTRTLKWCTSSRATCALATIS